MLQFPQNSSGLPMASPAPLALPLETLLDQLQTEDFGQRWDAVRAIQRHGEAAIAPLLTLLQASQDDDELLWFIVRALGESAHPSALQALMQILQTTAAEDVRQASATALAQHASVVLPLLKPLLEKPQGRSLAILVLAQMHHPDAIPLLLPLAIESDPTLRTLAIEALSYCHDPRVLPILKQSLHDPIAAIRRATLTGLGRWNGDRPPADLVALIAPLLHDSNPQVQQQAILSLGRLGTEAAIAPLVALLRSPTTPASLRLDLVRSLSWIEHPLSLVGLKQALCSSPDPTLAQDIAALLGRLTDTQLHPLANQILLDALRMDQAALQTPEVRRAIAHSLGQLHQPDALAPLMHLLLEGDRTVQLHALAALKHWPTEPLEAAIHQLQQQVALSPALQADLQQVLDRHQNPGQIFSEAMPPNP